MTIDHRSATTAPLRSAASHATPAHDPADDPSGTSATGRLDARLYRWSALCLLASFGFSLVGGALHPIVDGESHSAEVFLADASPWAQYSIYVGALFLMLGLPGGYLFFRARLGTLGLLGFAGYFLGNALSAQSHLVVEAFVGPAVAADPGARHLIPDNGMIFDSTGFTTLQIVGSVFFLLSLVVIGVALVRAEGLPSWVGVLLVAGALLLFVPIPERPVLTGLLVEVPRGVFVASLAVLMLRQLPAHRTTAALR